MKPYVGAMILAGLFLAACGGSSGGGGGERRDGQRDPARPIVEGAPFSVEGLVTGRPLQGQGGPLSGARVHLSVDRDGDGRIAAAERVTATTDAEGRYRASTVAAPGATVVVAFEHEGHAPAFRSVIASAEAEVTLDAVLAAAAALSCEKSRCATADGRVSIDGLPTGLSGRARLFNPVTETDHFPGAFTDVEGNLLVSGVFASVELEDGDGNEVDRLDRDVELRLHIPRDTWPVIVHLAPGNGRIDLPLYAFDEVQGDWVRHPKDGWLEDATGAVLPESALPAVRSGTFAGALVVAGPVDHFSYWNLDWPIDEITCVGGRLTGPDGKPVAGALVTASGVTYVGTARPAVTDEAGRFVLEVLRSEEKDEDLDQDGEPGEIHRVAVSVTWKSEAWDVGEYETPPKRRPRRRCMPEDLGDGGLPISLSDERKVDVGGCDLCGTVEDHEGQPLAGAFVQAWDPELTDEQIASVCGEFRTACSDGSSGSDGAFEMRVAARKALTVWAMHEQRGERVQSVRWANVVPRRCPKDPLRIRLAAGYDQFDVEVSVEGEVIAWQPDDPLALLQVAGADGALKWMLGVESGLAGFRGPVEYGKAPAGASVAYPLHGEAPMPLASGDVVQVTFVGPGPDGFLRIGGGSATVQR